MLLRNVALSLSVLNGVTYLPLREHKSKALIYIYTRQFSLTRPVQFSHLFQNCEYSISAAL
jgi:hypothetical protein